MTTASGAGGVISQLVSKKQKTNLLHEDEQRPFLSDNNNNNNDDDDDDDNDGASESSSLYEKKFLNIDGMTCGACSAMIQKLLTGIDGVESSSVSLMLKRAEVVFNPNETSLDDIIEEIEDIGFTASELLIATKNKNNFTIQLFYPSNGYNKQQILDKLMTIEGVSYVDRSSNDILPTVDMSLSLLTPFRSLSMMDGNNNNINIVDEESPLNTTSYGTTMVKSNKYSNIDTTHLTITYDPNITGMRTITEWINNTINTDFKCKILFDASDISQRKKNIQQSREREIAEWTRLFKYSLLFSVPAFLATMVFPLFTGFEDVFNLEFIHGCSIHDALLFLLSTPIQFGPPGILFYRGAYKSLRSGSANMDVLVALATSISYFFSIIQVIICIIEMDSSPNTTFETSAVLITVIILGKYMETIAKGKTSQALDKLMDLAPSAARLVTNWNDNDNDNKKEEYRSLRIREIDARLIELNDILEVPRGHKCPCDGIIIEGISSMDESLITGESMAVHKEIDDEVIGATLNLSNTIYIKVNKIGNETVLSKIITLVENAQASRAPIQNLADMIASRFVPIVIAISIIVFIIWYIGFSSGFIQIDRLFADLNNNNQSKHSSIYYSFLFSISVLVVSCPCALGLATPTAVMVATGKAAELGILFKGGEPLEISGKTNCIIFDKTGTLTQGQMQIIHVIRVPDRSIHKILKMDKINNTKNNNNTRDFKMARNRFWNYIYGAEKQSEHLIASAVCNFIEGKYHKMDNNMDGIKGGRTRNEDKEEEYDDDFEDVSHSISISETFRNLRDNNMGYQFECEYWKPDEFIPHTGMGVTAIYKDKEENITKIQIGNLKYMNINNIKAKKLAKSLRDEQDDDDYDDNNNIINNKQRLSVSSAISSSHSSLYSECDNGDDMKYEDKYLSIVQQKAIQLEMNGNTCVFIAVNNQLCGILAIADKIKSDAFHVIDYLQNKENIPCYMITGDNQITATAIGKLIGIPSDHIRANVSPADKQNIVKQLQNTRNIDIIDLLKQSKSNLKKGNKSIVTFVGDGINDSPSLAQADIGIAIGAGTDVAIASASVVLMNSKLIDVLNTIDISKATVRRIRYNFGWALIYNLCMIPFAAGTFYPFIHYALPPFMAGLLMCLSSISVVCNSLLLKLYKPPKTINNKNNNNNHNITDSLVNNIHSWSTNNKYHSYDSHGLK